MAASEEAVGPTDMSPPRPLPRVMNVKVHTDGFHARISTIDGSVRLVVPAAMVAKRMRPGEEVAFFRATTKAGSDVLELGDRLYDKTW
jgi:hypothetical protein